MKKFAVRLLVVVVVLGIAGAVITAMFLDSIIKKGVETVGPKVAKVPITLEGVSVSVLSGGGGIRGLNVGNPDGFKTPASVKVGEVSVQVDPMSVFKDKIVVRSVKVAAPEITLEGSLKGSNLSKILENVQAFAASEKGAAAPAGGGASKKLQVDELEIRDGKVNLSLTILGGKSATVPLPTIQLKDLGRDEKGITPAELSEKIVKAVLESATQVAGDVVGKLGKDAVEAVKDVGQGAKSQLDKVTKGVGGLFKK